MPNRLEEVIERLLKAREFEVVDGILDYIDVEHSYNCFTDLVDIACICKKWSQNLNNFYWFKQELVNKIYEQRGDEGNNLIQKVMK